MKLDDPTPSRSRPAHYPIRSFYVALTLAELDEIIHGLRLARQAGDKAPTLGRLEGVHEAELKKLQQGC